MKTQHIPAAWRHESNPKSNQQADTRLMPLVVLKEPDDNSAWKEGALMVGLAFSLGLTMVSYLAR